MIHISKPIITEKDIADVAAVMRSGMIVQGPRVKELEERFADYVGAKHAVAVTNGTAALHAALYALGVGPGDEVITTPFTFVATANAILMQGAKVVFVDIDEETYNISPEAVEAAITDKTKAILPVSLYGLPYDQRINKIAKAKNLFVLEDAAQSIGAGIGTKKSGSLADISSFSMYATKNIMAAEGGMITTDNEEWAELCRRFRHHGQSAQTRYQYFDIGYNYRMTDIHAAIGLNQLARVEEFTEKRNANASYLTQQLAEIDGLTTPSCPDGWRHAYHQYTIRVGEELSLSRDQLKEKLIENGVGAGIYYPKPLHLHLHFEKFGYKAGDFPKAEKVALEVLSLPVHPSLSEEDLLKIVSEFKSII